ncbi:hypothetical protein [Prosthecobacter vanneervenii]|uniref:Uncharacterized protein n=1 Tax=Prosthecobacter vanneervenii TaxID=48466 RepID=A0A7W7Y6S6_9BACT|nr:hypothetical protein [Prosthecobacter vanneervenii]MBB5030644.1 hypothetical protein [Prosthecobacter vanneervenii]
MAFHYSPSTQSQVPDQPRPPARIGKFTWLVMGSFFMLVVLLVAWHPVKDALKTAWGRQYAKEAQAALSGNDITGALPRIIDARRWAPEDVEVIKVVVEFLKTTRTDPATLAQQLKLLSSKQPLTEEQEALLGESLLAARKTVEARAVYERMEASGKTGAARMDLLSKLLSAEGHAEEAAEISRRSMRSQAETSPEARLQRAMEDRSHSFPEVRRAAYAELWEMAAQDSQVAMQAMLQLSRDPELSIAEARRLQEMVDKHPHRSLSSHLAIVSALLRLQPEQRVAILDAETARFKEEKEGNLTDFARWLAEQGQHARLLKLLPQDIAIRSRDLYSIMADALVAEGRWKDLHEMLTSHRPPVSAALAGVWLAEVESHLQPDLKETTRLLQNSIDVAKKDVNPAPLIAAGVVAEKLNLLDIAVDAYRAAAMDDTDSSIKLLQKAAELAQLQKVPATMLAIARRLQDLRPTSAVFAERCTYLRLVLGLELELAGVQTGAAAGADGLDSKQTQPELLRALAAYRFGDKQALATSLKALGEPARLPPGQRAVAAGLLALSGKNEQAYQIAERVPEVLLLDEERQFLQRAK